MRLRLFRVAAIAMLAPGLAAFAEAPSVRIDARADAFAALSVPDISASATWYQRHFGLAKDYSFTSDDGSVRILVLSRPGLTVELQQHSTAQALRPPAGKTFLRHGIFKFGIMVSDVRDAVAKLSTAEVQILVKPFEDQGGRYLSAVIVDNSGNTVQLFEKITKPALVRP